MEPEPQGHRPTVQEAAEGQAGINFKKTQELRAKGFVTAKVGKVVSAGAVTCEAGNQPRVVQKVPLRPRHLDTKSPM